MSTKDPKQKPEFYRRVLPDGCIDFSSPEGKTIFKEALASGHMECYFKIASQFSTQAEPAFCGLTTLVMILNALEVDPGRVWKGPWRWYHEDMLECCVPLHVMKETGITFDQFVCLTSCNSLESESTRLDDSASFETFKKHVFDYSKRDDAYIALTYSRGTLKQTGDGHFSPMGGYHPDRELILVMDTARFKYPPHWVPLSTLWEAMKPLDKSTGKSRGYSILSKISRKRSLPLFRLSECFSVFLPCACTSGISAFVKNWRDVLTQDVSSLMLLDEGSDNVAFIDKVLSLLLGSAECISRAECIFTTYLDVSRFSEEHRLVVESILRQIECLNLYKTLVKFLQDEKLSSACQIAKIKPTKPCCQKEAEPKNKCPKLVDASSPTLEHFTTVLLLCWPYELYSVQEKVTVGAELDNYVKNLMNTVTAKELKDEIAPLKMQLSVLMKMRIQSQLESDCGNDATGQVQK